MKRKKEEKDTTKKKGKRRMDSGKDIRVEGDSTFDVDVLNSDASKNHNGESHEDKKGFAPKLGALRAFAARNKIRRQALFQKQKFEKNKLKREQKLQRKRLEKQLGDKAPPKQVPKTLESLRVFDETIVAPEDEEVQFDEKADEFGSYFSCERIPKVLITTCDKPRSYETLLFIDDLTRIIPNSEYHYRKGMELKKVIPQATARDFTDIIVVNEDHKRANALLITHLPDGPTAHFKLSSVKRCKDIKHHGKTSYHRPELVLNNFNTRLGHSIGRLLAALFPFDPQFQGRRCVTFHNQRDFVFFRHHRYIFKNSQKVGLQEVGPRFTLKLRSLQKGTFDSKFGEYEWIHKDRLCLPRHMHRIKDGFVAMDLPYGELATNAAKQVLHF